MYLRNDEIGYEPFRDPIEEQEQLEDKIERLQKALDKAIRIKDYLIKTIFRRQEIYKAWEYKYIFSWSLRKIADKQKISIPAVHKRIKVANDCLKNYQSTLHMIDD